jgi:hypothetical protein
MTANFYLGRTFDLSSGKLSAEKILYNPADLTTHAVVTGMTGSGKTGLCIGLMEEAALEQIPALIIDPKGDLTNLLLHFPDLAPPDFQPWLDTDMIRRQGKTLEQASTETAGQWKQGLADWGITPDRIRDLKDAVNFSVFTPGSDAGLRVNILSSLEAPSVPWEGNREILREKISATVTALLGLVGFEDIDPVRSREHILLANIFENAWSQGKNLDLTELILQTQTPPFEKLGAFPVETFFPEKERIPLAMVLNNILAAPTFEAWREGHPLDIPSLLFSPDGKPRHNVFYIAHLSDAERMFFITLLLSAVETWMRTQAGSSYLRALIYFDEIYGYLPPTRNPPSKQPLLRMLKQARAFGVGLLLATQNPVDVDYKGLSNAGTWFVGKLQTERDKERLLDGLESVGGGLNRAEFDKTISALGKRIFLLHNVHEGKAVIFQTRWTMNFLAGPLTRTQIPLLNKLAGAGVLSVPSPVVESAPQTDSSSNVPPGNGSLSSASAIQAGPALQKARSQTASKGSLTKPTVPAGVDEFFLPLSYSLTEAFTAASEPLPAQSQLSAVLYRPVLLATAKARFLDRRYGIDSELESTALVDNPDKNGSVRWDDFTYRGPSLDRLENSPAPQAIFESLNNPLTDPKTIALMKRDFSDWIYRTVKMTMRENKLLKVVTRPGMTQADFMTECTNAARAGRDLELAKAFANLDRQIGSLERKLEKEQVELENDQEELNSRTWEQTQSVADNVLGVFRRGRTGRLSRAMEKNRLKGQAEANVEESKVSIAQLKEQINELQKQRDQKTQEITNRWGGLVDKVDEISLTPRKSDIFVDRFGIAWMPFYQVKTNEELIELPAFGGE